MSGQIGGNVRAYPKGRIVCEANRERGADHNMRQSNMIRKLLYKYFVKKAQEKKQQATSGLEAPEGTLAHEGGRISLVLFELYAAMAEAFEERGPYSAKGIRAGPIQLLCPLNGTGPGYMLIGLHWRWSITWRWVIYVNRGVSGHWHFYTARKWGKKWTQAISLVTPLVNIDFRSQQNMRWPPPHWRYPIDELIDELEL